MNDSARQALWDLVASHGQQLSENPRQLRALLNDYCPELKREVNLLVAAAEHRVVADMLNSSTGLPWAVVSGRLVRRMVDELAVGEEAARWAVETWGVALGRARPTEEAGGDVVGRPGSVAGTASAIASEQSPAPPETPAARPGLARRFLRFLWRAFWFLIRAAAVLPALFLEGTLIYVFFTEPWYSNLKSPFDFRFLWIVILMNLVVCGVLIATFKDDLRGLFRAVLGRSRSQGSKAGASRFSLRVLWRGFRARLSRFLGLLERWVVMPLTVVVTVMYVHAMISHPPSWTSLWNAYLIPILLIPIPFLVPYAQVRHLRQNRPPGQRMPRAVLWAVGCGGFMLYYGFFGWGIFSTGPVAAFRLTGAERIRDLAFSYDGKMLAAVTSAEIEGWGEHKEKLATGKLVVWDIETQTTRVSHDLEGDGARETTSASRVSFHPNNRVLAVSCSSTKAGVADYVLLWDLTTAKEIRRVPGRRGVFSPDGKYLAVTSGGSDIQLLDTQTLSVVRTITSTNLAAAGPTFSPRGDFLAAVVMEMVPDVGQQKAVGTLAMWETATGLEASRIRLKDAESISGFAWGPGGSRLAIRTNEEDAVRVWDLKGQREVKKFKSSSSSNAEVAFCDDQRLIVIGGVSEHLIYELENDRSVPLRTNSFSEDAFDSYESHLVCSPTGQAVAATDGDVVYVWRLP